MRNITGNEPVMPATGYEGRMFEKSDSHFIEQGKMYSGLTIRQHFAAMAMQGLCANYLRDNVTGWDIKSYAVESVILADALIAELNIEK